MLCQMCFPSFSLARSLPESWFFPKMRAADCVGTDAKINKRAFSQHTVPKGCSFVYSDHTLAPLVNRALELIARPRCARISLGWVQQTTLSKTNYSCKSGPHAFFASTRSARILAQRKSIIQMSSERRSLCYTLAFPSLHVSEESGKIEWAAAGRFMPFIRRAQLSSNFHWAKLTLRDH